MLSYFVRKVYSKKKEKRLLKDYNAVRKKVTDMKELFSESTNDGVLTEEEYKIFLSIFGRLKGKKTTFF